MIGWRSVCTRCQSGSAWQTGGKGKEQVWEVGPTVCSCSGKGNIRHRESILQQEVEQRELGYCWEGL